MKALEPTSNQEIEKHNEKAWRWQPRYTLKNYANGEVKYLHYA